jgi:hypothetical protein
MHTILSVLGNRSQLTSLVDMRPLADTFIVGNKPKQNGEAFFSLTETLRKNFNS